MSYGADHAGGAGAEHLFDALLLQSKAQLAHGEVALGHFKLALKRHRRTQMFTLKLVSLKLSEHVCLISCEKRLGRQRVIQPAVLLSYPVSGQFQDALPGDTWENDAIQWWSCQLLL